MDSNGKQLWAAATIQHAPSLNVGDHVIDCTPCLEFSIQRVVRPSEFLRENIGASHPSYDSDNPEARAEKEIGYLLEISFVISRESFMH